MTTQLKNKLFETFTIQANSLGDNETLTLLVQTESITISSMVHKDDLNHSDWKKVFNEHLDKLEELCKEFNIPYSLGSVKIVNHYYCEEVAYGKMAMSDKERKRQSCQ